MQTYLRLNWNIKIKNYIFVGLFSFLFFPKKQSRLQNSSEMQANYD